MLTASAAAAAKFDSDRAGEYEKQSRIGLAGYDACHELSACMLAAALGAGTTASILVVGAGGTAQEIVTAGKLEPNWRFTAVDPSRPMLDLAVQRLTSAGLAGRTDVRLGYVDDLPGDEQFDAATLIGVLHHLPGEVAKENILKAVAKRLKPKPRFFGRQPLCLFEPAFDASGLIHSDNSQIVRSSSSSRHESRNCCERHTSRPPSA